MRVPLLYRDEPMFGFDIGSRSIKLMQLRPGGKGKKYEVMGYGYIEYPADTIIEGIIVDPEPIIASLKPLLAKMTYGKITAKRAAISLPVAKVFTRVLQLPPMDEADLAQAIRFEAEQYIPVPLPDLYIDYMVFEQNKLPMPTKSAKNDKKPSETDVPATTSVLMVAAPRAIVDSYIKLLEALDLEVGLVESSLSAATRALTACHTAEQGASLIADIGGTTIDVTVFDQVLRLTNTIALGGDDLTEGLVKGLGVSPEEATEIKFKFGVGPSGIHDKIIPALEPKLKKIVEELRRVMRFYGEREQASTPITTLVLTGGTAGMPGLVEWMAKELGMNVILGDAWDCLSTKHVQPVSKLEAPLYTTTIGLAEVGAHL